MIVWLVWIYDLIANLAPLRQAAALAHARSVLDLERVLHIDPEAAMDHWLIAHHFLAVLTANYYDNAHFVVTLGLVVWIYWRHPDHYRPLRNNLVIANLIGLTVFFLYPMAPPRLLDPRLFADVVAATHAFGSWHTGTLATAADQLAAMPSMHIAWAAWSAYAFWRVYRQHRWARLAWAYPLATALAVLSTGNHFVIDVVAGALTTAVSTAVAEKFEAWWEARRLAREVESLGSSSTHI